MKYISLFSGIGGLESSHVAPIAVCEIDPSCQQVLRNKFPFANIHENVLTMEAPNADLVAGGWPCQDISVAGLKKGLTGERSGLFFRMLQVARNAEAHTIIAENVPNLLRMDQGKAFRLVVATLQNSGFTYVAWRVLNAREFALPQNRNRVFLIASKHRELAESLHRPVEQSCVISLEPVAGFYWTAGLHGICYSQGFVPALKIGSSVGVPSPPAIHFNDVVRKATANECLAFQGFALDHFTGVSDQTKYSMAGNAVALPVGRFVVDGVLRAAKSSYIQSSMFDMGSVPHDGIDFGTGLVGVSNARSEMSSNLAGFVDRSETTSLSKRAAAGLLSRLARSGKPCPDSLRELLVRQANNKDFARETQLSAAFLRSSTV